MSCRLARRVFVLSLCLSLSALTILAQPKKPKTNTEEADADADANCRCDIAKQFSQSRVSDFDATTAGARSGSEHFRSDRQISGYQTTAADLRTMRARLRACANRSGHGFGTDRSRPRVGNACGSREGCKRSGRFYGRRQPYFSTAANEIHGRDDRCHCRRL